MNASKIEKIIANKIIPDHLEEMSQGLLDADNNTNVKRYNNMLINLKAAERIKDNYAFRPIFSHRKYVGKVLVFCKRIVRKCLKWYIEPICFQQTEFNNYVIQGIDDSSRIIKNLIETNAMLLKEIEELKLKIEHIEERK